MYPHVCGAAEKQSERWASDHAMSVYPHVCGADGRMRADVSATDRTVYPHVCGADDLIVVVDLLPDDHGLSPRVRGRPASTIPTSRIMASVPVYPHVCGAAIIADPARWTSTMLGLSPRVRGSQSGVGYAAKCAAFVSGLSPRVRGRLPSQQREAA